MRIVILSYCTVIFFVGFWTGSVHAQETQKETFLAMSTTPPKGLWVLEGDLGAGQHWFKHTNKITGEKSCDVVIEYEYSAILPSLQVGITDRLHLGILNPGIAYRFGEHKKTEWVPYLDFAPGIGWSKIIGVVLGLTPELGFNVRHWLTHKTAINWSGYYNSYLFRQTGGDCIEGNDESCKPKTTVFEWGSFGFNTGGIFQLGKRVTLSPQVGVMFVWNRIENEMSKPIIRFLGANPNGLWDTPFVRVHMSNYFAIGANVGAFLNTNLENFGWDASVNLLVTW